MEGYFDFNATTPVSPAASEAWQAASTKHWHNASSLYREGAAVSRLLEAAQLEIADRLGADEPDRVLFNSGATESNNAVLEYVARSSVGSVLISSVEHPSVTDCARSLLGDRLHEIQVDRNGIVDVESLRSFLRNDSNIALVSVMAANNESGVLQPWQEIQALCQEFEVPFHCDAAQWIGKLPADGLGACDYVTGSAHKFGGPKGTGFLLIPEDEDEFRSLLGGPQQERRRAGTENYPAIAAMLASWRELEDSLEHSKGTRLEDRTWAETALQERLPGIEIVGGEANRLWNTILVIVPAHDNRRWLIRLNRRGFAVSTGSACSSGKENPSRVLQATGHDYAAMGRTIRISSGWDTTRADWQALVEALVEVQEELSSGD